MREIPQENKQEALDYLEKNFKRTIIFNYAYSATNKLKSTKLASFIYRLFESSRKFWKKADDPGPDCRRGCSFCCHLKVEINKYEALHLVKFLKKNMDKGQCDALQKTASIRAALTDDNSHAWWTGKKIPCVLLNTDTGDCRAYEARPLVCRKLYSYKVSLCESGYEGKTNGAWWWAGPFHIGEEIGAGIAYALIEKDAFEELTIEQGLAKYL